jgi:hypothetical protein
MTGPRRWAWFNSRSATPAVADVEDLRRNNTGIVKHDVCIKRKLETEVSSVNLALLHRYGQPLCVYAALIALASNTDNARARWKRPDKMPEFISVEESGGGLSIDHHDVSGLGCPGDLNNAPVLHD